MTRLLVLGDRTEALDLARLADAGPWDSVVDTSGYVPREVLAVARVLEPVVQRYVFVSTVSVYEGWPTEPLAEDSAVLDCPADAGPGFGYDGDPGPSVYGFTKSGAERAVTETFGAGRSVILRPGVIIGPREYVGRVPWWLRRVARGGRVLAPGSPQRAIQPVDVRDVADFALRTATGPVGTFNVTAAGCDTMGTSWTSARRSPARAHTDTWAWLLSGDTDVRHEWTSRAGNRPSQGARCPRTLGLAGAGPLWRLQQLRPVPVPRGGHPAVHLQDRSRSQA